MPFLDSIMKYLPLIQTGLSATGDYLGGRAQKNAITNASGINQKATDDAMKIIMGLYDEGQANLAPYRNVGPQALNNLQALTNQGRVPAPASVQPAPTGNAMTRFAGPTSPTSTHGSVTGAMGTPQKSGKNALLGTAAGAAGTMGLGMASSAMLGGGLGLGASLGLGALGGPVGMGLMAGGSLIASQFGKNNPYKEVASKGIDQVSRNIWGTNTPGIAPEQLTQGYVADALHGRLSPQDAKARISADLDEWVAGMRSNGTPDNVIQSSIATQKQALAPLNGIFAKLGQPSPLQGA